MESYRGTAFLKLRVFSRNPQQIYIAGMLKSLDMARIPGVDNAQNNEIPVNPGNKAQMPTVCRYVG